MNIGCQAELATYVDFFIFYEKATYVFFKLTWTYALPVIFIHIPSSSSLLSTLSSVVSFSELHRVEAGDLELVQR